jgi:LPS-assembly protein
VAIVAARQGRSSALRRSTHARRDRSRLAASAPLLALVFGVVFAAALGIVVATPASAQSFTYNPQPPRPPKPARPPNDGQMLVQANEVDYDYNNSRVAAVGNVQLFYNGTSVEADKVIYDQKTKRLHAEGNIRMTDVDGKITYANILDLSDDYRDGFVDSLHVDTADATRMAATRADRSNGNYTVFENGVYTACAPCKDDPKKPPLWQVKGARIIHDQINKMLYFENAQLEFFGVPLAYAPYGSAPDPTVKKKSGFLMPEFKSGVYGYSIETPYFWNIAPDYDATFDPRFTTQQGVLLQAEFRQRLLDGSYQIRAYGIDQLDPSAFAGQPGDRQFRGGVETKGEFALNDKWVWGWDGVALSDYMVMSDYNLSLYKDPLAAFLALPTEAVSQLYLTGVGDRSYFDARAIYFLSLSGNQSQVPVVAPVIDYSNVINHSVFGGEVSYKGNFTSLTRDTAAFDPVTASALANGSCLATTADPARNITPANCLLRGMPGTYTRATGEVDWRRSFTDSAGEIWTPFASIRADAIDSSVANQPGVSNFLPTGETQALKVMPTVGLEYRYPFINVQPWGTTTIVPIVQVIARPNEPDAGKLPNEDAQSFTFDTSNLFSVDKFSGYDREEGGGRANVGVQATTEFDRGGTVTTVFGQSYQLFGLNSFAVADVTNTALDSGLDKPASDYVASISYSPNRTWTFSTRARFDEGTGSVERFEAEARANFDRFSVSLLYGDYAAQPEIGFLTRREGVLGTANVKLATNWVLTGAARWDLVLNQLNQYAFGVGYVDDCFVLGVNYVTSYSYATTTSPPILDHVFLLQLGLRTLANTSTQ